MTSLFFDSFQDAQSFAKESANNKIIYTVKRNGNRFVAELKSDKSNKSDREERKRVLESGIRQKESCTKQKQLASKNKKHPKSNAHQAQQATTPISDEEATRKLDLLRRGVAMINKLNKQERTRNKAKGGATNSTVGWTSLSQGERKLGDAFSKRRISEGIAGTREDNKKMRSRGGR
jgi:hypothetical protein